MSAAVSSPTLALGETVQVLAGTDSGQQWVRATVSVLGIPGMPKAVGVKLDPAEGWDFPAYLDWDLAIPAGGASTHLVRSETRPGLRTVS